MNDLLIPKNWRKDVEIGKIDKSFVGKRVRTGGWIKRIRDIGKMKFIILGDRSGEIQIVVKKNEVSEDVWKTAEESSLEDALIVTGEVVASKAKRGIEIKPSFMKIVSKTEEPPPIIVSSDAKIPVTLFKRLDYRVLDLRDPKKFAIFKIESLAYHAFREFLEARGFIEIQTPVINAMATEGGAEVFPLNYFGKFAYLRQSPQLHKQMVACAFDKVFEIGPAFRAEPHHTPRHLCEFTSADVEMAWIESENDLIELQEDLIIYMLSFIEKNGKEYLKYFDADIKIPTKPFPRIPYREAYEILKREYGIHLEFGEDIGTKGERLLYEYCLKKYNHEFVFLTKFPFTLRPAYHMKDPEDPLVTRSMDLLYRGMEITTGSQREHRYSILRAQIIEKGQNPESYGKYLEFFKYGMPPHGGFAIGISRFIMQLLRLGNIREAVLFPRDPERLEP